MRSRKTEVAIALAAFSAAWGIGTTLFFSSGGMNPAGLVPSPGCLVALWGAVRSDRGMMAPGTTIVVVSALAFVFSLGFVVVPAAIALLVGAFLLGSGRQPTA